MKKFLKVLIAVLVIGLLLFGYFRFYFVFGEGVKSGTLNYVVKKGLVFKTYEGKLIQSGLKSGSKAGSIQSYEFEFSVVNKELANKLMLMSGQNMELRYKEYFGRLPWRGYTKYIVYELVSASGSTSDPQAPASTQSPVDTQTLKEIEGLIVE